MMFGRKTPGSDSPDAAPAPTVPTGTPASAAAQPQADSFDPPDPLSTPAEVAAPGDHDALIRSDHFQYIRTHVFQTINVSAAVMKGRSLVRTDIEAIVADLAARERLKITRVEQRQIVDELLNDMFGTGPVEPLLEDDTVTDILVNGPDQIYVERHGRLELTSLKFRDERHVRNVAQRIAASVGRRVDESSPMVDARLADGSRVNVVMPPLAIRGTYISIRKFAKRKLTLGRMAQHGSMSQNMARLLEIASACRLNVVISGGTGTGKTTLMNAMSRLIDPRERIVTIEDAAELQLQQPHVASLETRPQNAEGLGEVSQRDLVRNALRMRPDRIILGETRGAEAFDVLQAMNTGHDGSMTTIHANNPRDAISRLESMVMMANGNLPLVSIRRQIASAVQLFVQLERMRDGMRRVTHITEIVGMEGDVIITQDLFTFQYDDSQFGEEVKGVYQSAGLRPHFSRIAVYYGQGNALAECTRAT